MEIGEQTSSEYEGDGETGPLDKSPTQINEYWTSEMDAAERRLRDFVKQGNKINERFLDERDNSGSDGNIPFRLNLLHANVTTKLAMMYGRVPKIDVGREHSDPDDDVARVGGTIIERILTADASESGTGLGPTLRMALQDRLLPGLGTARVRYCYETEKVTSTVIDFETGQEIEEETEQLASEDCPVEYVHWQDFRWGWSRTWSEVPWVAFRSWMDREEVKERFGSTIANQIEMATQLPGGSKTSAEEANSDQKNNVQQAEVWEIWCKKDRKVYWWAPGAPAILDVKDDPLELSGFWPCPKPMMANATTNLLQPRADFIIAQDLYNEIDTLQTRISTITRAIKVVGVYDKSSEGVQRMMNEGVENQLIPVDNWAMFAEKGGLRGQIDWFPVQDVVQVLQTLTTIRDQTIDLLYQVTGMSDILRGQSNQYSGVGQEQLKAKFGSIRVQALQDQFAEFASDLSAIKAEVVCKHFDPNTIATQSNAEHMPEFDRPLVPQAMEFVKSPDFKWRVDIKPESIAMVDYAQLKSERTEFVKNMATFIQSMAPMVQSVPQSMPVLLEMLKWSMAGFKGSDYMEGMLDQAIDMAKKAPPQQDDQRQQEQQQEMQREQMQHQMEMQKIQAKAQADVQVQQAKFRMEMERNMADHQQKMAEQQAKNAGEIQKIVQDLRADIQSMEAKKQVDISREQAQAANAAAEHQVTHENELAEMSVEHEHNMREIEADAKVPPSS